LHWRISAAAKKATAEAKKAAAEAKTAAAGMAISSHKSGK